ncbi:MAG: T9SS type A sorting domain-containing protein, partial [Bacteroidales bacterium]|nr:T9SS type A sorting domain-containing protein [Bacteroidales bacterium]
NLTNGELTQIGSNLSPAVTITIDNDGVCYAQGIASGRGLGTVNLTTGVFTQARANNVTAFTGMLAVDRGTNEVYATTFNGTTIQKINKTSSTLAGTNTGTSFPSRVLAWTIIGKPIPMTPTYTVNITPATNGTITVMSGDNPVADGDVLAEGTILTLTAIPGTGYVFEKWWDDNTNATRTHTLTENVTISATFEAIPTYTVTIIPPANGIITVMNDTSAVNTGDQLEEGTILTLSVMPDTDYEFAQWWDGNTENPRSITLNSDIAIGATFEAIPIYYTVTITPGIGGIITVMSDEDEVFHGDELEEGTELTLIATAHEGFKFVEWWHGGTDETHIHILDDHVTISATFTDDQTSIVVTTSRELFVVFPSPTTDLLHIQTEEMIQQIVILDLNGKVMMQLQGNRKILDLQSLPIGNYIVRIHTKTAIVPIKIVKQ